MTLDELTQDEGFIVTDGLDLIWQAQDDPRNVIFHSPDAELQGMQYHDREYRWPAVYGTNGTITVTVPRAGSFYPAVVAYDSPGRQTYEVQVDGRVVGRFVAAEDDKRQRMHFLDHRMEFQGGEQLTVRVGSVGPNVTEDLMLLAERPPVRRRRFEMGQIETGFAHHEGADCMRLTWITTWPSQCRIEYGKSADYGELLEESGQFANHRVYLSGLQPGATYRYRLIAPKPDGSPVVSQDLTFTFETPTACQSKVTRASIALKVHNPYDFTVHDYPVTSGVPFASGELGDAEHLRLLGPEGKEVPLQARVTGRWLDGSVKWVLLTFMAQAEGQQSTVYLLEYGGQVTRQRTKTGLYATQRGDTIEVNTGPLQAEFEAAQSGFPTKLMLDGLGLSQKLRMGVRLDDGSKPLYTTNNPPELLELEEAGPLRVVVHTKGHHLTDAQKSLFAYEARFIFYANCPFVRVLYAFGNEAAPRFSQFRSIVLHVPVDGLAKPCWSVGLGGGKAASGQGDFTLEQLRDDSFSFSPESAAKGGQLGRAEGWVDIAAGDLGLALAVRNFWQLYPKSVTLQEGELQVGLCPEFPNGFYDNCSKLDEIKFYYYLMGGQYKLKQGVKPWHEMLLLLHEGDADHASVSHQAQLFQQPLIATCPPERYAETLVFGPMLPATLGRMPEYEQVCGTAYRNTVAYREIAKLYGMHNFGDWWGERRINWGNNEYDTAHACLVEFARSADPRWYFWAEPAARHAIDIDTCHYGEKSGAHWTHCMGHVGDYFSEEYEGNGLPQGGIMPSHTWTEGFCDWYFLSGDTTALDNAGAVADYYAGTYLNNYDYSNCRDSGWNLIMQMATYHATGDPYYLNAARIIVERVLERQTPGQKGWHRQLTGEHCYDVPHHRGEANFMLGVLCSGLEIYYEESGDARVAEAIVGGANQAIAELWVPEVSAFRYTTCPNTTANIWNNDMTVAPLFFAQRYTGKMEYGEVAMRAMQVALQGGIGSPSHLRWTPRLIYHMDLINQA